MLLPLARGEPLEMGSTWAADEGGLAAAGRVTPIKLSDPQKWKKQRLRQNVSWPSHFTRFDAFRPSGLWLGAGVPIGMADPDSNRLPE